MTGHENTEEDPNKQQQKICTHALRDVTSITSVEWETQKEKTIKNKKGKQNENRKQTPKTSCEKRSTGFALTEKRESICVTAEKQISRYVWMCATQICNSTV